MHSARNRLLVLMLACLLLPSLLVHSPMGCLCGPDASDPESSENLALPPSYPRTADVTAGELARFVPKEAGAAFFVASYASLIEALRDFRGWKLVDSRELDNLMNGLAIQYGLNPNQPASYREAGVDITKGAAVVWLDRNVLFVFSVENEDRFRELVNRFINSGYGRPRPRRTEVGEHTIETLRVLTKDVISVVCFEKHCLIATGQRFDKEAKPSVEVLKAILEKKGSKETLAEQEHFQTILKRVGSRAPFYVYSANPKSVEKVLLPLVEKQPLLQKIVKDSIGKGVKSAGMGLVLETSKLRILSFAVLPNERLEATRAAVTPDPQSFPGLKDYITPGFVGLARMTFDPKEIEDRAMQLLDKAAVSQWRETKASFPARMAGLEPNFLYNLAGQVLVVVYRVNDSALGTATTTEDIMSATEMAVFLPLKDPALATAFFGRVQLAQGVIQGAVPQAQFGELEGRLLVTLKRRSRTYLQVMYDPMGVLVIMTGGEKTSRRVLEHLKSLAQGPGKGQIQGLSALEERLLGDGAVWGLTLQVSAIEKVLASRYDIVKTQIATFLAPLHEVALQIHFEDNGLGLDLEIELGPPRTKESEAEAKNKASGPR